MLTAQYAKSLIERFGENAEAFARDRAAAFRLLGDFQEEGIWLEILEVIRELKAKPSGA